MEKLYVEVCEYIKNHNSIEDNLYNGILLKVYNEYSYSDNKNITFENLEDITYSIISNDYFDEVLTECIENEMQNLEND